MTDMSGAVTSYGVQLYSVRDALAQDTAATLDRLAAIGFANVEPFGFVERADALEPALRNAGLSAPSGHNRVLSINAPVDRDAVFAAAARLGIGTVIDPFLPAEYWQDLDSIARTADALNEAAADAGRHGLRVGYHNHQWELASVIDGATALELLAARLDPAVVLEVDTYWAAVGGADPVELLHRLGDRVRYIHIKDGPATADIEAQLPAGQGVLPVLDIVDAAAALEVGVVEFDAYAGDVFDGVAQSLAFLRKGRADG